MAWRRSRGRRWSVSDVAVARCIPGPGRGQQRESRPRPRACWCRWIGRCNPCRPAREIPHPGPWRERSDQPLLSDRHSWCDKPIHCREDAPRRPVPDDVSRSWPGVRPPGKEARGAGRSGPGWHRAELSQEHSHHRPAARAAPMATRRLSRVTIHVSSISSCVRSVGLARSLQDGGAGDPTQEHGRGEEEDADPAESDRQR